MDSVEAVIDSVEPVEKILNYSFTNKTLLKDAITHGSSSFDRFKFVGEAALALAITNHIYFAHPTLEPMELTLLRSAIKSTENYAFVVAKHGLHQFFIRNVESEEKIKWFTELVGKEDNPIPYGGFVKAPHILGVLIETLAGVVYIDVSYDIKRLWEIFKPLFEPIYTLDDLRLQPQPVVTHFRWADKNGKRIDIRYSECSKGKGTMAQGDKSVQGQKHKWEGTPKGSQGGHGCFRCGNKDHKVASCPQKSVTRGDLRVCYHCKEVGHIKPKCPKLQQGAVAVAVIRFVKGDNPVQGYKRKWEGTSKGSQDGEGCFGCGSKDHKVASCPQKGVKRGDLRVCYHCKELGHIKPKCPKLQQGAVAVAPPVRQIAVVPRVCSIVETGEPSSKPLTGKEKV